MEEQITNGLGPMAERLIVGPDNLRKWDEQWLAMCAEWFRPAEVPVRALPYAFTQNATAELEMNNHILGCPACKNTEIGVRVCRFPAHSANDPTFTNIEPWTVERYASVDHLNGDAK